VLKPSALKRAVVYSASSELGFEEFKSSLIVAIGNAVSSFFIVSYYSPSLLVTLANFKNQCLSSARDKQTLIFGIASFFKSE
jgi:hypothetical protein